MFDQIKNDLKKAMIEKQSDKLSVLRMLVSAINNESIQLGKKDAGLTAEEELKVIKREVKKRKDSIQQFESAGREELAKKEKQELEILSVYLPEEMGEDEIKKIVLETINEMGEIAPSQFGQLMGSVMGKTKGQADGVIVSKIVKEVINNKR